ncbi:MAG TPA: M36 family metallopeptidase [Kofleriaceae bacterium]|nr:M36 family metallopeptidase [Kofleriaceae bacterium]
MRPSAVRVSLLGLALVSACAEEPADPTTETVAPDGARILRAGSGTLTPPSAAEQSAIVRDFLRGRAAVDQLVVTSRTSSRGGIRHLRFEQRVDGLRVHGAYVKAAITDAGELVQVIDASAPASPLVRATAGDDAALAAACEALGHGRATAFHREPSVERVAYADRGALREGFLVETWTVRGNLLDHTLVDGHGRVISTERRTSNDRYNVFAEDPSKGAQAIVTGGVRPESPAGWLGAGAQTTHNISGNNVRAYLDVDSNNVPDGTGTAVTDGDFLTAADLAQQPSTTANRNVAVQNLFYHNNLVHDVLYRHGFDEAAGNFQANNFGLGGAGNDAVNAEAQDGGGLDNANFATPTDGSSPRMQMYLWSGSTPPGLVTVSAVDYGAHGSAFGPALTATGVTGPLALVNDGAGVTSDGCEASPAGSLTGKTAIVDRGSCDFTVKVANAQAAGAVAVLIANNVDGGAFSPGGTNRKIKIPSAMVTLADGATLRGLLGASSLLRTNPNPPLRVDGDLDTDVIYHEYGHGLTWRMIGGMSGPLAGALGEGSSDTLAFLINGDDRIGEYSASNPLGIRRQPYATYVGSYGTTVTGASVHNDGEVYAAAMYRVLTNYLAAGLTADDVLADWVGGHNFAPSTPAYEHMRDAMLQAAPAGRACLIWEAFAHYGIGVGAQGKLSKGGSSLTITESFAKPATCP